MAGTTAACTSLPAALAMVSVARPSMTPIQWSTGSPFRHRNPPLETERATVSRSTRRRSSAVSALIQSDSASISFSFDMAERTRRSQKTFACCRSSRARQRTCCRDASRRFRAMAREPARTAAPCADARTNVVKTTARRRQRPYSTPTRGAPPGCLLGCTRVPNQDAGGSSIGREYAFSLNGSTLAPGERLLEIADIDLRFGGIHALDGVGLTVAQGEIHSIIGPNGAGKSSLINCVSGLYRPQRGRITLHRRGDSVELVGRKPHEIARLGVARSFQNIELFRHLTVLENLM